MLDPASRTLTRRTLLGAATSLTAAIGAGSQFAQAAPSHPSSAAAWESGDIPAGARAAPRMAAAARAFLGALDATQRSAAWYSRLSDPARTKWSNFPAGASPRAGIALGHLTDPQRVLLHDLLRASTSSQGYHKMTGAIRADDVLHDLQPNEALFGAANYYAAVFGSPQSADWAWMLTGHHMTAIFTVAGKRTGFTPMFTGAQPLQTPSGLHAGWQVLPHDAGHAGDLLASLSDDQRRVAVIGTSAPQDVIAGPGRQSSLATMQGIASPALGSEQQRLLWLLVEEFARNAHPEAAEAHLALVRTEWQQTHFSWLGPPPDAAARYYFRVHGPRIIIEYDVQEPLSSGGGHVHAITRDPRNDYGADWLGLHYQEGNPLPNRPGGPPPNGGPPPGGPPPGGPPPGGGPP